MTPELLREVVVEAATRYPKLFESLVIWLQAPDVHGKFEINRGTGERVRWNISRGFEEG